MEPIFKVSHIYKGQATFKTKGLYRVIYHNAEEGEFVNDELLTLKKAYWWANYQNNRYRNGDVDSSEVWAEIISYKDWVKREKELHEKEARETAVTARLKKIEAEKAEQELPAHDEPTGPLLEVVDVGNGIAHVSTVGLCRVVIQPGNTIKGELMPAADAEAYASAFNSYHPEREHWAEAQPYQQ